MNWPHSLNLSHKPARFITSMALRAHTCSVVTDMQSTQRKKEKNQHTHPPSCRKMQAMYKHYKLWVCFLGPSPEPEKLLRSWPDLDTCLVCMLFADDGRFLLMAEGMKPYLETTVWAKSAGGRTLVDRRNPSVKFIQSESFSVTERQHRINWTSFKTKVGQQVSHLHLIFSFLRLLTVNHFFMQRLNILIPGFMNCMWKILIFM